MRVNLLSAVTGIRVGGGGGGGHDGGGRRCLPLRSSLTVRYKSDIKGACRVIIVVHISGLLDRG